ncbi:Receptor-interacting serine/threonine-protein kinase 4 [Phytophthora nicotianae]|uniref:Receptor-interacting serine/threonine-protein kinase 4 n=1 Tax=Phytophthora nicotianae TaxID=4792 RepID=A0A0W8DI89_PHYNI|nr:Receptor-interacting serine/threonine-protein kinase 4 [Phytophthora nicotianae]
MMRLKGAGFSAIANAFREREKRLGGGLPLLDFVEIVLPGLPRTKTAEEKATTVSALVDLFEDIDINGDGSWSLTNLQVSASMPVWSLLEHKVPPSSIDTNEIPNMLLKRVQLQLQFRILLLMHLQTLIPPEYD